MGMRATFFLEIERFLDESSDFFVKSLGKRASYELFWLIIKYTVVLTELAFFLLIMGMTTGGFHEKVEKNYSRAQINGRKNIVN